MKNIRSARMKRVVADTHNDDLGITLTSAGFCEVFSILCKPFS